MDRTFAIIKPDAVAGKKAGAILARIEKEGFTVRAMRLMHMTKGDSDVRPTSPTVKLYGGEVKRTPLTTEKTLCANTLAGENRGELLWTGLHDPSKCCAIY